MAASFNTELMHQVATAISDEARGQYNEYKKFGETDIYQGLTYWSPNINIFRDPRWGRGHETYGEDPYLSGRMGTAFIKGLQGEGKYRKVDATIKHYAVHSGPETMRHGFDGYVVSDCGAICDINRHHKVTGNEAESAALAVNNGCELNCGEAYKWLKTAVALELISEETITEAVTKLFTARFRLGMFDDDCEYDNIPFEVIECKKHKELNRKMAQESIVLLKNNGILPLDRSKKIAVIGPNADSKTVLLGNYNGNPSEYYTLLRGLQQYSDVRYSVGCHIYSEKRYDGINPKEAIVAAKHADVVILCMGNDPGFEGEETDDYNMSAGGDKATLDLPSSQKKLFEEIAALGKPMIFVNVSGSCINLSRQKETCDAILQCFYPGAMGGLALADIIFGEVSPSGRLPVTFYESVDDLPPFEDYSMENRTYKFYKGTPVYEFGHGLTYSEIRENWLDENTVELSNVGTCNTDYTVLKYEQIPYKNLCGFQKVHIKKGQKIIVKFA